MEALNVVPGSGSFSYVVSVINENNELITDAISQVENNTEKFAGVFSSSSDLPTTGVANGMWAAVLGANGFPAAIYEYDGTEWSDSGKTWEPDSASTAAVDEAKVEAIAAIETAKDAAVETVEDSLAEVIGEETNVWVDLQYQCRPDFYGGQNQNARMNASTAAQIDYNTSYSVHFFKVEENQKFHIKNVRCPQNGYKVAFFDAWDPKTGSNGNKTITANFISGQKSTASASTNLDYEVTAPTGAKMMVVQSAQNNSYKPYQTGTLTEIYIQQTMPPVSIADKTGMLIDGWTDGEAITATVAIGDTMPFWGRSSGKRGNRIPVKAGQVLMLDVTSPVSCGLVFTDASRVVTEVHTDTTIKGAFVVPNDGFAYVQDTALKDNYIYNEGHGGLAERIESATGELDTKLTADIRSYDLRLSSDTAAATVAKTATATGFALTTGRWFLFTFENLNTATNPTLNINSTGAKRFYYNGTLVTGILNSPQAGELLRVYYDGTYYQCESVHADGVISGTKESLAKSISSKGVLSDHPFVNAYFQELAITSGYSASSVFTVKVARNYNQLEVTFYKDGTEIGSCAYSMWTASGATTITVNSPTIRTITNSGAIVGYYIESRNKVAKYYLEYVMTGVSSVLGTFTLNNHVIANSANPYLYVYNSIIPRISQYETPLRSANSNQKDAIKEVYIVNYDSNAEYRLKFSRNYTKIIITLLKDDVEYGSVEVGCFAQSTYEYIRSVVDGRMHKLMSGANVVGYVILKSTSWLETTFTDASVTATNIFTTDALYEIVVRDVSCSPAINTLINGGSSSGMTSPWADKVIAMYGDSVSAGNDAIKPYTVGNDWPVRIADYLGAARIYNRSMPSTSNKNQGNGGRICGVDETGHQTFNGYLQQDYAITWTSYKNDPTQITVPSGTEAVIPSAGCFWERITKMFPAEIKSTIDAIFIFFHNDGSSSVAPSWVANSTVDAEWAASGSDYYGKYNGDYNIGETTGALYSTIMKMQLWMPQALIILCTPWSGLQNTTAVTANRTAQSENVRYAAINNSVPLIDVNAICAVNGRNGSLYMKDSSDSVHPNANGGKLLARAFCSEMLRIVPKF